MKSPSLDSRIVNAPAVGKRCDLQSTVCEQDPHRRLATLGAAAFAHVNGSLESHLRGTEALLRRWGNRDALCVAGLYHAVYGTDGITGSLAGIDTRADIARIIGAEAERLAYLYGACARDAFHPRIGTANQLRFTDRFAGCDYAITLADLRDLCEITVANELELASAGDHFRARHACELVALVERMEGLVTRAAVAAARDLLLPAIAAGGASEPPFMTALRAVNGRKHP